VNGSLDLFYSKTSWVMPTITMDQITLINTGFIKTNRICYNKVIIFYSVEIN
jgi:hypothetical protein